MSLCFDRQEKHEKSPRRGYTLVLVPAAMEVFVIRMGTRVRREDRLKFGSSAIPW